MSGIAHAVTRIDCRAVHLLAGMSAASAPDRF
jgi:hypothetical protein